MVVSPSERSIAGCDTLALQQLGYVIKVAYLLSQEFSIIVHRNTRMCRRRGGAVGGSVTLREWRNGVVPAITTEYAGLLPKTYYIYWMWTLLDIVI